MMELPKNRILKGLVYATTVAVVLCYAWLTARLMEPSFKSPPSVAVSVFARTANAIEFFEDIARDHVVETARLTDELEWAQSKFQLLGALRPPLRVVVNLDKTNRLIVTADRIEIGTAVLKAKGQLKKAIVKAWLLQRVSPDLSSSLLRLEVASDFLLAVLDGGLSLEAPGQTDVLDYTAEVSPWWSFADNYKGLCKSPWRSLEVSSLCETASSFETKANEQPEMEISNLSFRPFLGQQLWLSYLKTPMREREHFVRAWLASISEADGESLDDGGTVSAMTAGVSEVAIETGSHNWPRRLKEEMDQLLSADLDPRSEERSKWSTKLDAPLIVIDPKGRVTAPGTLKLATDEIKIRKAKLAFLTSCQAPTLETLTSLPVDAARVVWKPECDERKNDFIQVRPSSVALALKRGLAKPNDRLDAFVHWALKSPKASESDLLGVKDATWDSSKKAFKVRGALEAVEEFRLSSRM